MFSHSIKWLRCHLMRRKLFKKETGYSKLYLIWDRDCSPAVERSPHNPEVMGLNFARSHSATIVASQQAWFTLNREVLTEPP